MNTMQLALQYLTGIMKPQKVQAQQPKKQTLESMGCVRGADGVYRQNDTQQSSPQPTPIAQATRQLSPTHPLAEGALPQPDPTMSPYTMGENITSEEVQRKLQAGFQEYSKGKGVPMEQNIPQLVEGAQKYPGLKNNPFLTAAVSLNETSGGQNWTNLKNPVSWGARIKDTYQPNSAKQAIEDMMSAVGGDPNRGTGYDPTTAKARMNTAAAYKPFRDSKNLQDFSFRYESPKNNPDYYKNLIKFVQMFERQ